MSNTLSLLTFTINNLLYGIETQFVIEIFSLPELSPTPDAPDDIVGVVNLRGDILPVMDLNLRFGYQPPPYRITNTVLLLRFAQQTFGLIVSEVHEVIILPTSQLKQELSYRDDQPTERQKLIKGLAYYQDDIIILPDIERLFTHHSHGELPLEITNSLEDAALTPAKPHTHQELRQFCPHATPEELAIFRDRAQQLRQTNREASQQGHHALAVVKLNGEFFGIKLAITREFIDIKKVTPVPCCPPHIIGNINLRGEILTLIDTCGLLHLPLMHIAEGSKAVVVTVDNITVGVIVEDVLDIVFFESDNIAGSGGHGESVKDKYVQGTIPYQQKFLSILDMNKILLGGGLLVNETV